MKIFIAIQNNENKVLADKEIQLVMRKKARSKKNINSYLYYELPDNFSVNEFIQDNTEKSYPQLSACTLADKSI